MIESMIEKLPNMQKLNARQRKLPNVQRRNVQQRKQLKKRKLKRQPRQ